MESWGRVHKSSTYLTFDVDALIVAIGRGAHSRSRSSDATFTSDTTTLGEIFFALAPANLYLLLFTTTTQLLRLEGTPSPILGTTMLGDVSISHLGRSCINHAPWRRQKMKVKMIRSL